MSISRESVLERMRPLSGCRDFRVVEDLLSSSGTKPFDPLIAGKASSDRFVLPKDIIKKWSIRCQNARTTGRPLFGCDEFVEALRALPENLELVQFVFTGKDSTGLFWFVKESMCPVGFVVTNKSVLADATDEGHDVA